MSGPGGVDVVALDGELDLTAAPALRARLVDVVDGWADGPHALVLDLSAVGLLDSSALGALVAALKLARARGGQVALAGAGGLVARTLQVTGLLRVFPSFPDADAAVAALAAARA